MGSKRIGFVGLGTMGAPMAGHLVKSGTPTTVWNRTPSKAEALRDGGAAVAASLGELAAECDAIAICVNRTEDVRAVLDELAPCARPGCLLIDHSTISPNAAKSMHADLGAKELRFVDAPITGGSMGAQNGTLTIFLGGVEADCAEAASVVQPYAKRAERVGGPGSGQMAKMANQIAVAGAILGLCESMSFAQKAGLDLAQVKALLAGGAAGSWAFENYGPRLLVEDWSPGFSVKNQRKDFGYCLEAASDLDACLAATRLADSMLAQLEAQGRGDQATTALFDVYRQLGADCA